MSGALSQLKLNKTGVDKYIIGNPQITFFKSVFRRYTNFAIDSRAIPFIGGINFGQESHATIPGQGGDLLYKLYLQITLPKITCKMSSETEFTAFRWLNWIGHRIIDHIKLIIDGQEIDNHKGEWLHIWNELSQKVGHREAYAEMVGNVPKLTQIVTAKGDSNSEPITLMDEHTIYIPLQFWFCKNPGLSIPLIALKNSHITMDIQFRELADLIWASSETNTNIREHSGPESITHDPLKAQIFADFIYLDDEHQRRFKNTNHDYLIEKVQINTGEQFEKKNTSTITHNLTFTNPVKELIWVLQPINLLDKDYCQSRGGCQPFNYTDAYDYKGFSGTPQPSTGAGMAGGRNNYNMFYSLPGVQLPFIKDTYEPKFTNKPLDSNGIYTDNFSGTKSKVPKTNTQTLKTSGFDYISQYHTTNINATEPNINNYSDKNIDDYLGVSGATQVDDVGDGHGHGIWSSSGNQLELLHSGKNIVKDANITLNSVTRIDKRDGFYFNTIQPYQYHTNTPSIGINVYSFSLEPENTQPTGTCNFTHIDNASLNITVSDNSLINSGLILRVYALSYNILQIKDNKAYLSYSYDYDIE